MSDIHKVDRKINNSSTNKRNSSKGLFATLGVLAITASFLAGVSYFNQDLGNNGNVAQAALNCPAGSSVNTAGTGCVSILPSVYTCPNGQTVSGSNCLIYTCPYGGNMVFGSCEAVSINPINLGDGCWGGGAYTPANTSGSVFIPDPYNATVPVAAGSRDVCLITYPPSNSSIVTVLTSVGPASVAYLPGIRVSSFSYPVVSNTVGIATPQYITYTPTSYTPNNGQITGFSCTPTAEISGGNVVCSGQATGAPSGVPYSGDVIVTIDNGGGTATVSLTSSGSFSTTVGVGITTGTKTATTNIGGTSSITVNANSTPLTPTDIPNLTVTCGTTSGSVTSAAVNSTTTCTFPIPANKTLPTDFKLSIGSGSINQTTGTAQSCTVVSNIVTCTNVPTGNSIGNLPIYGNLGTGTSATKTDTGEKVNITGTNFGNINWNFSPDQGGTSPLFRSTDNTSITINNLRTIFDPTPSNNNRYTCSLEYRNFNDRLATTPTWTALDNSLTTPKVYTTTGTTQGCTVNLTKTQRANILNHSLRLTITDTTITTPSTTYVFYNEYIYRFQGAGVASGG